ncbi:MAG: hypothetical protein ANABAC_3338 [Anaerolineae bacterium]|nr:MAG: hypothetical protein ANABAC_3338 [Anaerolineae bacterium]
MRSTPPTKIGFGQATAQWLFRSALPQIEPATPQGVPLLPHPLAQQYHPRLLCQVTWIG